VKGSRGSLPTFVHEIPLRVTPQQAAVLRRRFNAATSLYNGCLREAFKRLDLCRQSRPWQRARACRDPQERRQLFKEVRAQYGFREYDLIAFAGEMRRACWMAAHIDGDFCITPRSGALRD
jgi:hypothetical protein